ncbi:hypothetical protein Trydic_g3330 [Trypoxylus dichotomus]
MAITIVKSVKIGQVHPRMVCNLFSQHYCSDAYETVENKTESTAPDVKGIPEPPTTCCMTGCPNCVWLEYAENLTKYFKDGGEKALKEINAHVTDSNVRAYLMHELRMRNKD